MITPNSVQNAYSRHLYVDPENATLLSEKGAIRVPRAEKKYTECIW